MASTQQTTKQVLGSCIRTLRKERGLTLEAFARRANISYQYLSGVETGKENFSLAVLETISAALGVPLKVLIQTAYDLQSAGTEQAMLNPRFFRDRVPLPEGTSGAALQAGLAEAARAMRRVNHNFRTEAGHPVQSFVGFERLCELVTHVLGIALSRHTPYKLRAGDSASCVMSVNGRGRKAHSLELRAGLGPEICSASNTGASAWHLLALYQLDENAEVCFSHVMLAPLQGWQTTHPDWVKTSATAAPERADGRFPQFALTPTGITKLLDGSFYLDPAKVDPSLWHEHRRSGEAAPEWSVFGVDFAGR